MVRLYLVCLACRLGECRADSLLGLADRLSRRLQTLLCWVSVDLSFSKTSDYLFEFLGVWVSDETIRKFCLHHGIKAAETRPGDHPRVSQEFREARGEVEFHVDAAKVNTVDQGWRDVKAAVFLKRPLGEGCDPFDPKAMEERTLPEPEATVSFAAMASIDDFQQSWEPWQVELGVCDSGAIDVHGDGAEWIWNAATKEFPEAEQALDPYHGFEHIGAAAKAIHGEGTAAFEQAFARGRQLLLSGGWKGLCDWVGEQWEAAQKKGCGEAIDDMLNYFKKHAGRLDYARRIREGRGLGSGAVEGMCKTLGLRLKARSARWLSKHVNPMAALITLKANGGWDTYFHRAA